MTDIKKQHFEKKRIKVLDEIQKLDKEYSKKRKELENKLTKITEEQYAESFVQISLEDN